MMEKELEDLLLIIGQTIVNNMPVEWSTVILKGDLSEWGVVSWQIQYTAPGTEELQYTVFNEVHDLFDVFEEIRNRTKPDDEPAWNVAIFTLQSTGKYDIEFEYPD